MILYRPVGTSELELIKESGYTSFPPRLTVEMETAAFFAVSKYYDIPLVQLLYTGDDVSGASWNARNWNTQKGIRENLIRCAVDLMEQL